MKCHDVERNVFKEVCQAIIAKGWWINCWEDYGMKRWFPEGGTQDVEAIIRKCFDKTGAICDEWFCGVFFKGNPPVLRHISTFHCVAGNEGYNLVSDYHMSLDDIITPISEKWERIMAGEETCAWGDKEPVLTYAEVGDLFKAWANFMKQAAHDAYRTKTLIQRTSSSDTDLIQYNLGRASGFEHAHAWAGQMVQFLSLGQYEEARAFITRATECVE